MRVLVIDQCSGTKSYSDDVPELSADQIDSASKERLVEDAAYSDVARRLYSGRQQKGISEAVESLRSEGHDVQRYFVSAGFGLIDESEELPPYNVTFETELEAKERGRKLGLASKVREVLRTTDYDVAFLTLGSKYYAAIDLSSALAEIPEDAVAVVFNQEEAAEAHENVLSLQANTETGRKDRIGGGVMGVKAEYLKNFARNSSDSSTPLSTEEVKSLCHPQSDTPEQTSLDSLDGES